MSSVLGTAPPRAVLAATRIASVDLIRGAAMILMAIDHVRIYAGIPPGGPTPGIFFTRWITHFCAPAFILLAGTSAYFYGRRHPDLSQFLLLRGIWFILLELTIIRVGWTFNLDFTGYLLAGVIWVIGWCMILMAGLVQLPLPAVAAFGVVVIGLHNAVMPPILPLLPVPLRSVLYTAFLDPPIGPLMVLYSIIPWVGVMAAGYAFGQVLTLEPQRRDRICYAVGLGAVGLFLLLRGTNIYGDPLPSTANIEMPALLSFLNTTKYPASFSFLLMTLGPTIALIPLLERARGRAAEWVTVFGRVPFFFYVLHIPLIHGMALVISWIREGTLNPWLFANHPMGNPPPPEGYAWSLGLLYLIWAVTIVLLYSLCRRFARFKAHRKEWWLSYL
ncbi:MAG TPA: heparan-alpha-glucosaminide N-acetyltransferase domain-containing protein [Gemmatimonadales bacterium]|nr:heparan-alpha-glucosaminide N-acetyltransferase domain-containing protein [Gemmatimonadales bacterium]